MVGTPTDWLNSFFQFTNHLFNVYFILSFLKKGTAVRK
ncbi:hypothetical protein COXBURSA334_0168 [Coxiella burnetii Q321]|nr:hypothetical protein COXBURSA334_0168 [Coxiella burnetii Q321]